MEDNKELGSIADEHLKIIVDGEQAEREKELQPDVTLDKADQESKDQVKKGKKKKNAADPEGRNDQARIHG